MRDDAPVELELSVRMKKMNDERRCTCWAGIEREVWVAITLSHSDWPSRASSSSSSISVSLSSSWPSTSTWFKLDTKLSTWRRNKFLSALPRPGYNSWSWRSLDRMVNHPSNMATGPVDSCNTMTRISMRQLIPEGWPHQVMTHRCIAIIDNTIPESHEHKIIFLCRRYITLVHEMRRTTSLIRQLWSVSNFHV